MNDKSNPVWTAKGQAMLDLIDAINQHFMETRIWGLTSHDTLLLQTDDNWESGWYVAINNIGTKEYYFEYRIPKDKCPWPHATVKGMAPTLADSVKYLAIAMNESGGWQDNKEVKRLLEEK